MVNEVATIWRDHPIVEIMVCVGGLWLHNRHVIARAPAALGGIA